MAHPAPAWCPRWTSTPPQGAGMSTDFIDRVFTLVDDRDAEGFAALFAPDGRFVFANADPIQGPAAIAATVGGFFATIDGLRHEVVNRWEVGSDAVAELDV